MYRYLDILPNQTTTYTGGAQDWKLRYYAHGSSFRDPETEEDWDKTEWTQLCKNNWKIIEKTSGFNPVTLQCKICLSEIYHIVNNPNQANLNFRLETFSYCRHLKKYLLSKAQFFYIKGGALLLKSGRWVFC